MLQSCIDLIAFCLTVEQIPRLAFTVLINVAKRILRALIFLKVGVALLNEGDGSSRESNKNYKR